MRDFGGPAYQSYVALCRELRLERELAEGDWVWQNWAWLPGEEDDGIVGLCAHYDGGLCQPGSKMRGIVWLPQLADWLDMLEAAGWPWTATGHLYRQGGRWGHCVVRAARSMDEWSEDSPSGSARTREEAAARLWMAVTGR